MKNINKIDKKFRNTKKQIDVSILHADVVNGNTENKYAELEKGRSHIIVEIVEYVPNSVVSKTIIKKSTGSVTALSLATGEEVGEKASPFDMYVQIIDGKADIITNGTTHTLPLGTGFIIPANSMHRFIANERFKMICTIIKSGYDI